VLLLLVLLVLNVVSFVLQNTKPFSGQQRHQQVMEGMEAMQRKMRSILLSIQLGGSLLFRIKWRKGHRELTAGCQMCVIDFATVLFGNLLYCKASLCIKVLNLLNVRILIM
jgi:hypothetical protein